MDINTNNTNSTTTISTESPAQLCAGIGHNHSNALHVKNRRPYNTHTIVSIRELVDTPSAIDKDHAPWIIPSTLLSRVRKDQREKGQYHLLWCDIDTDPPGLTIVGGMVASIMSGCQYEAYTSISAREDLQKSHALVPLAVPLEGSDWEYCQAIFNDKLDAAGIEPDRASEKANQLCYLPNRGEFYQTLSKRDGALFNPLEAWSEELAEKRAEGVATAQKIIEDNERGREKREAARAAILRGEGPTELIAAFNATYDVKDILIDAGYEWDGGTAFLHPDSTTGSFSGSVKDGFYFTLGHNDKLWSEEGKAHSAFSAYCDLNHNKDLNAALRESGNTMVFVDGVPWNKAVYRGGVSAHDSLEAFKAAGVKGIGPGSPEEQARAKKTADVVRTIVGRVEALICKEAGVEKDDAPLNFINEEVLFKILERTYWNAAGGGNFCIIQEVGGGDAFNITDESHFSADITSIMEGPLVNSALEDWVETHQISDKPALTKIYKIPMQEVITHLRTKCQQSKRSLTVDPFATKAGIVFTDSDVVITFRHTRLDGGKRPNGYGEMMGEYREHFPQFEAVIDMFAAARFAPDGKKAYLWLKADSDWGKGLLKASLEALKLSQSMTAKNAEKIFAGGAVPYCAEDFIRTWVIIFDEFKNVNSEMKQFESKLTINEKHKPLLVVPVFAKMFLSAEHIGSLAGSDGVEKQFNNRFSYIEGSGSIERLSSFKKYGGGAFRRCITYRIAELLNKSVDYYVSLGREAAGKKASEDLAKFHRTYGLRNTFDDIDVDEIGEEIVEFYIHNSMTASATTFGHMLGQQATAKPMFANTTQATYGILKDGILMLRPSKVYDAWKEATRSYVEGKILDHKKHDIFIAMGAVPNGKDSNKLKDRTFHCLNIENKEGGNRSPTVKGILLKRFPAIEEDYDKLMAPFFSAPNLRIVKKGE